MAQKGRLQTFEVQPIIEQLAPAMRSKSAYRSLIGRHMTKILKIATLGSLDIRLDQLSLSGMSDKAKALLLYLIYTKRAQTRLYLAELLWEERTEKQARGNLRTVLTELRKRLPAESLIVDRKTLAFNPAYPHQVDVLELESALNGLKAAQTTSATLPKAVAEAATEALDLYKGEFLAHFYITNALQFEAWRRDRQSALERKMQLSLNQLIQHAFAVKAYQQGEHYARRMLQLEPADESTHRQVMELLARQGRRDEALRQYRICCKAVADDLEIGPSPETTELFERIRMGGEQFPIEQPAITNELLPDSPNPTPYHGLSAFMIEDSHLFFGRDTFVQGLLRAIESLSLVTVLGASGSGKSSVVFAGLIPALLERPHERWHHVTFRPAEDPFIGAATALVPLLEPDLTRAKQITEAGHLADHLRKRQHALAECLLSIQQIHPQHRLLIVIDQFEELFTLVADAAVQHQFLGALSAVVETVQGASPRLVCTLRADFTEQLLLHRPLVEAMQDGIEFLGPMTRSELRAVIEKPAHLYDVAFETKLVGRLLDDVGQEDGSLPLLEFALTELWQRRQQQTLTHVAYEEIGQLKGALGSYAEDVYQALSPANQEAARRLFVQLVNPGNSAEDTRRRAIRSEFETEWPLVSQLATKRLIVTNQGSDTDEPETVEIVHEALIRHWERLKNWMDEVRAFRTWQERIRFSLEQWHSCGRSDDGLLRGMALIEAEHWLAEHRDEIGAAERDFIKQSIYLWEKQQRQEIMHWYLRWGAITASTLLLVLLLWMGGPSVRSWWLTRCLPECPNANLSRLDLTGAKLAGANLSGADLSQTTLSRAALSEANLEGANLNLSNLEGAELWGAHLKGANLIGANLTGANLEWADLNFTKIDDATKIGEKWHLVWEIVNHKKSKWDLPEVDLSKAELAKANLENANLYGANLSEAHLWSVIAPNVNLREANLSKADLKWAILSASTLSDANFTDADLAEANLFSADLRGANFNGAKLEKIILTDAIYDANTIWPAGFDPQGAGAQFHK